jgi:hypothetical protein
MGMPDRVLADLRRRRDPLASKAAPLSVIPPLKTCFGSPLVLSRVHWVAPKLFAEITDLTWTADNRPPGGQAGRSGATRVTRLRTDEANSGVVEKRGMP